MEMLRVLIKDKLDIKVCASLGVRLRRAFKIVETNVVLCNFKPIVQWVSTVLSGHCANSLNT